MVVKSYPRLRLVSCCIPEEISLLMPNPCMQQWGPSNVRAIKVLCRRRAHRLHFQHDIKTICNRYQAIVLGRWEGYSTLRIDYCGLRPI